MEKIIQKQNNIPIYSAHYIDNENKIYAVDNKILNDVRKINTEYAFSLKNIMLKPVNSNQKYLYYHIIKNVILPETNIPVNLLLLIEKNIYWNSYYLAIYILKNNIYDCINKNQNSISPLINISNNIIEGKNNQIQFKNDITEEISYYIAKNFEVIPEFYNIAVREYKKITTGQYLYDNEDTIKYSKLNKIVKYINNKPYCIYTKDMIIFSKKTFKVYYIKNKYYAGSQILKKIFKQSIHDITFYNNSKTEIAESMQKVYKNYFKEEYDYTVKDLNACNNLFNLFPVLYIKKELNIKNTFLAIFIYKCKKYNSNIYKQLKNKSEKEILQILKINNKIINNIIFINKEVNIYSLLFDYIETVNDTLKIININGYYSCVNVSHKRKNFVHQYYKYNSKKKFFNQIITNLDIMYDCCRMFFQNKTLDNSYTIDFTNSIKYLHDILSKDYIRLTSMNKDKKIPQIKKLKDKFKNIEYKGIKYVPAKTVSELILAGTVMNICVASYSNLALKKKTFIILGYDKNNVPKTCIELLKQKDEFIVNQVKKDHNQLADNNEKLFLIDFFEKNNIKNKTRDLDLEELINTERRAIY